MLAKPLVACTYLSSIVSELFEPQVQKITIFTYRSHIFVKLLWPLVSPRASITQYVAWMERLFDAYKLCRSMYLSIFNTFWVIRCLSAWVSAKIAIFTIFLFPWAGTLVVITSNVIWMERELEQTDTGWPPLMYTHVAHVVSATAMCTGEKNLAATL